MQFDTRTGRWKLSEHDRRRHRQQADEWGEWLKVIDEGELKTRVAAAVAQMRLANTLEQEEDRCRRCS